MSYPPTIHKILRAFVTIFCLPAKPEDDEEYEKASDLVTANFGPDGYGTITSVLEQQPEPDFSHVLQSLGFHEGTRRPTEDWWKAVDEAITECLGSEIDNLEICLSELTSENNLEKPSEAGLDGTNSYMRLWGITLIRDDMTDGEPPYVTVPVTAEELAPAGSDESVPASTTATIDEEGNLTVSLTLNQIPPGVTSITLNITGLGSSDT